MPGNFSPYSSMKDFGVAWLGEVPAHWEVRRLKHLCTQSALYGANIAANYYAETGIRFLRTTDITDDGVLKQGGVFIPKELVCDYLLKDGDILISRSGTVGRSFLYKSKLHGPCSYAGYLVRFVLAPLVLPRYVFLFTKTQAFAGFLRVMAISSTIENVNGEKYANATLPLPPLPEQAAIVRYLDYMERRIQRYVRAKQKLVNLLAEQKQAIIHRAVTRGLDPDAPLKPSGVEWLGDVPAHWEVVPLKHWLNINKAVLPENTDAEFKFYYIDIGSVGTGMLTKDIQSIQFKAAPSRARRIVRKDDTIVSTVRTYLKSVWFAENPKDNLVASTGFAVLTPRQKTLPKLVSYVAQSNSFTNRVTAESVGIAYPAIAESRLGTFHVSVPPLPEQTAIVEYLDMTTAKIDAVIARTHREIELINEYRTRLIADVVTGKVDVRDAATNLPDEADAMEASDESNHLPDAADVWADGDVNAKLNMVAEPEHEA